MFKRIASLMVALVMMLSVMAVGVATGHAEIVDSGSCGDNVTYTLDSDGVLTISGTGTIRDRAFINNMNIQCVVIEDGVTSIGKSAFNKCSSLTSVTIPDSVTSIGNNAFESCTKLANINISAWKIKLNTQDIMQNSDFTQNVNLIFPGDDYYIEDNIVPGALRIL